MLVGLLFYSFLLSYCSASYSPIVTTSFGSIRGYEYTNDAGFTAHIFKKLPFAAAPIGDLRWKKPQPPKAWNETIDGTSFGAACAQRTMVYSGPPSGFSEDCLHLNIYSPPKCAETSCPVLFIIHGGTAVFESTMKFPDETLVSNFVAQGIVVVSTAYRLGAFGILALGDERQLPANLAMHDVLAAIHFVRAEVHAFGGDKDRITLMGHSTGAQMALLFAFSPGISPPGKQRLFDGIISMSGPLSMESEERQVERSHAVAAQMNCSGSAREIIDCMRPKTTHEILEAAFAVQGQNLFSGKGLIGITMAGELIPIRNAKELREKSEPLRLMLGTTLYELAGAGEDNVVCGVIGVEDVAACYEKYLRDRETGHFVTTYNTDSQSIIMVAALSARNEEEQGGEVYLYQYEYPVHATHTDDAYLVLGFHPFQKDENEDWLAVVYPRYFANFVKGRRPALDWYTLKPHLMNYYAVNTNVTSGVRPQMKFGYHWDITQYYAEMVEYDRQLSTNKRKAMNAPVEYH